MELSVVMPAYLEYENLRVLLPRMIQACESLNVRYEILIIGPEKPLDQTPDLCRVYDQVTYIDRIGGNSYGDAVRTGISTSNGKYTLFLDADGSHTPEFVPTLYQHSGKFDVVIASRYVEGGSTDNKRYLVLMSLLVNKVYGLVLGIRCNDISNSFKLYKTEQLKKLALKSDNFDIVEELLLQIKTLNPVLSIKEIPYSFKERMFGTTKRNLFVFMLSYFVTLLRLRISASRVKSDVA